MNTYTQKTPLKIVDGIKKDELSKEVRAQTFDDPSSNISTNIIGHDETLNQEEIIDYTSEKSEIEIVNDNQMEITDFLGISTNRLYYDNEKKYMYTYINDEKSPIFYGSIGILGLYINAETEKTNYKIGVVTNGKLQTTIQPASILNNTGKIVELGEIGIPITSTNARYIVNYLDDLRYEMRDKIEVTNFLERLGYYKNSFVLPNETIGQDAITFVPNSEGDKQYINGFVESGSLDDWKENVFNPIKEKPFALTYVLASFASLLVEKFRIDPFVVELSGNSSRGKTICMKIASSVWGNPDRLIESWYTTNVAVGRRAALLNNLPLLLDDTKKGREKDISSIVYQFTQGSEKTRGSLTGTQRAGTWKSIMLSTGEKKITEFGHHAGVAGRVITLSEAPFGNGDATKLVNDIEMNVNDYYGTAGKIFASWLTSQELDRWKEKYIDIRNQYISLSENNNVVKRLAKYMALIHLSALMLNECLYTEIQDYILYDVWNAMLEGNEEVDKPKQAMVYLYEQCLMNRQRFMKSKSGHEMLDSWGDWNYEDDNAEKIIMFPTKVEEILNKNGFDAKTILSEWKKNEWILTNGKGNTKNQRLFLGGQKRMIVIDLPKIKEFV
ncbi:DUF927 domain-containing protein [Bacillus cereus group sp. MYBK209-1]|uniref:DUF927 domain-containing protein n=1 Tax=Bacillus cereus group sp. MYBK209-1 TaxID=3450667 RepID=UPI002A4BA22F|nr:DUF927 domain-containing protein [Bacillus cereus]MDA2130788.1 DUF927 domain-containing protein [Bacillus cereus]MDA2526392.1 DUF927 domain-containing protein [Bacillus cereus]MDA2537094.1 DUF927 domain-containing protein [Bacillus cereus]